MSKANKRRRSVKPKVREVRAFGTGESAAAELMTVGWLLTTLTALACELGTVAATWIAQRDPQSLRIATLAGVLMLAAVCTGLMSLGLLAAAWRLRKVKPPRGITVFALFVGLAPLALFAIRQLMN